MMILKKNLWLNEFFPMGSTLIFIMTLVFISTACMPIYAQGKNYDWKHLTLEFGELCRSGKYDSAFYIAKTALEIAENNFGPNHPNVAISLTNLGLFIDTIQNKPAKAEPIFKRSLKIIEDTLGRDDPGVAVGLSNLANCYRNQGLYIKAQDIFKRALTILEKNPEANNFFMTTILIRMGETYMIQDRYAQAEPYFRRALMIRENAFGVDHSEVIHSLCNLVLLEQKQYVQNQNELPKEDKDRPNVSGNTSGADRKHEQQKTTNQIREKLDDYRLSIQSIHNIFSIKRRNLENDPDIVNFVNHYHGKLPPKTFSNWLYSEAFQIKSEKLMKFESPGKSFGRLKQKLESMNNSELLATFSQSKLRTLDSKLYDRYLFLKLSNAKASLRGSDSVSGYMDMMEHYEFVTNLHQEIIEVERQLTDRGWYRFSENRWLNRYGPGDYHEDENSISSEILDLPEPVFPAE